jgi:predicted Holliday junction resolvase-like endonuclease
VKQIIYIIAVIVLMIVAYRFMKKIKDVPEESELPLSEDLETGEMTEELNEENGI